MRRALAVAGAALATTLPASAHLRFPAVQGERYIELRLNEDPVRIGYRVGFGPRRAKEQRRIADTDRDGTVVASEGNAALDARTAELLAALRVCTGDRLDALDCQALTARDVELVEAEGWVPGATGDLHFAWTLRLRQAAKRFGAIRIEDGWEVPGVEVSDVAIAAPADRALISAGEGPAPAGVATAFTWIEANRGPGPRVVSASWPPPRGPSVPLLVIGALLAVAGVGVLVVARRRSHAREQSS